MRKSNYGLAAVACVALLVAGCDTFELESERRSLGRSNALLTKADHRAIISVKPKKFERGAVEPRRIICAEPSPDVATAVSKAFSLDFTGKGTTGKIPIELALAVARSRTEAMVQLGERLATIQLLRDALYRACEGFANGAITRTSYAVILAGIDSTMISMLTTEMVAGAFGRQLAAAGAGSGGDSAVSDALVKAAKSKFAAADKTYKSAREDTGTKTVALETAKKEKSEKDPTPAQELKVVNANNALEAAKKTEAGALKTRTERAEELAVAKLTAERSRVGISTTAGGTIAGRQKPSDKVTQALVDIHNRATKEDPVAKQSVILACITSLDSMMKPNAKAGDGIGKVFVKEGNGNAADLANVLAEALNGGMITPFGAFCLTKILPNAFDKPPADLQAMATALEKLSKDVTTAAGNTKKAADAAKKAAITATTAARTTTAAAQKVKDASELAVKFRAVQLCLVALARDKPGSDASVKECLAAIK